MSFKVGDRVHIAGEGETIFKIFYLFEEQQVFCVSSLEDSNYEIAVPQDKLIPITNMASISILAQEKINEISKTLTLDHFKFRVSVIHSDGSSFIYKNAYALLWKYNEDHPFLFVFREHGHPHWFHTGDLIRFDQTVHRNIETIED